MDCYLSINLTSVLYPVSFGEVVDYFPYLYHAPAFSTAIFFSSCYPSVYQSSVCECLPKDLPVSEVCGSSICSIQDIHNHNLLQGKHIKLFNLQIIQSSVLSPAYCLCAPCWKLNICFYISLSQSLHNITEDQNKTVTAPWAQLIHFRSWMACIEFSSQTSALLSKENCSSFLLQCALAPEMQPHLYTKTSLSFFLCCQDERSNGQILIICHQAGPATQSYQSCMHHFWEVFGNSLGDTSVDN